MRRGTEATPTGRSIIGPSVPGEIRIMSGYILENIKKKITDTASEHCRIAF